MAIILWRVHACIFCFGCEECTRSSEVASRVPVEGLLIMSAYDGQVPD